MRIDVTHSLDCSITVHIHTQNNIITYIWLFLFYTEGSVVLRYKHVQQLSSGLKLSLVSNTWNDFGQANTKPKRNMHGKYKNNWFESTSNQHQGNIHLIIQTLADLI